MSGSGVSVNLSFFVYRDTSSLPTCDGGQRERGYTRRGGCAIARVRGDGGGARAFDWIDL